MTGDKLLQDLTDCSADLVLAGAWALVHIKGRQIYKQARMLARRVGFEKLAPLKGGPTDATLVASWELVVVARVRATGGELGQPQLFGGQLVSEVLLFFEAVALACLQSL